MNLLHNWNKGFGGDFELKYAPTAINKPNTKPAIADMTESSEK